MAICDYIITITAQEYNVTDTYPSLSIYFDDILIEDNVVVKQGTRNTYSEEHTPLLPEWTKVKAVEDAHKAGFDIAMPRAWRTPYPSDFGNVNWNSGGEEICNYKFPVSLNDNTDNNKLTNHTIKINYFGHNCGVDIIKIELNRFEIFSRKYGILKLDYDNPEASFTFRLPIYTQNKKITLPSGQYHNIFSTPVSTTTFPDHECRDKLIAMIDDFYAEKEGEKYGQANEEILLNENLRPLWVSFQNAFDEHCEHFNLPKVIIRASWVMKYDKLDSIQAHTHPSTCLIGTYYPKTVNGSPLIFEHPYANTIATNNIRRVGYHSEFKSSEYEIEELHVTPTSEMFTIFPATVRHCVRPTKHEQNKYILVANTVLYSEREQFNIKDLRYN